MTSRGRAARVRVTVKHRLRGDGKIWVDRVESAVRRDKDGGYAVGAPDVWDRARMDYDALGDRFVIELDEETIEVPFHEGEARFIWKDRAYHIASMVFGEVHIDQDGRAVATGFVTVTGVRLETVEPELLPLIRPLAWGLALRREALAGQNSYAQASAG